MKLQYCIDGPISYDIIKSYQKQHDCVMIRIFIQEKSYEK